VALAGRSTCRLSLNLGILSDCAITSCDLPPRLPRLHVLDRLGSDLIVLVLPLLARNGHGVMSDLSPLWMAPALQEIN
jgi:hypothetical protein